MSSPSSPRSRVEVLARLRSWPALAVLVGWTLVLWFSRLRNVLGNDELTGWGVGWRAGVVVVFVGLALAATTGRLVGALVWWTVGFWLVRGGGILIDGSYDAGFKLIHTALMDVSISAAVWVWKTRTR